MGQFWLTHWPYQRLAIRGAEQTFIALAMNNVSDRQTDPLQIYASLPSELLLFASKGLFRALLFRTLGSGVPLNSMHRSPKTSLAFLLIFMTGCLAAVAQNNQATPNPGSGVPQTRVQNTAPSQPAATAPAAQPATVDQPKLPDQTAAPASSQQNPAQPAATDQKTSGVNPGSSDSTVQKSAEQKAADQRVADQKSADEKSKDKTGTPAPVAQPGWW